MSARRKQYDSASLIEADRLAEAQARATNARALPLAQGSMPMSFADACACGHGAEKKATDTKPRTFGDPGHEHGPSIKCPSIYEALRKKGYDKEKAARISNSKC